MKLILILGTSLSAAGLAMGFALVANQAVSRESAVIEAPYRVILPSRVAPDLAVPGLAVPRQPVASDSRSAPQKPPAPPAEKVTLASVATAGNAAIPADTGRDKIAAARLVPLIATSLAERPPRRPLMVAQSDPLPGLDSAAPEFRAVPAKNFEYLPLIGVYR